MSNGRVLYDFQGDEDALQVYEGEMIVIIKDEGDGWLYAEKDGATGLVPASYVEIAEGEPAQMVSTGNSAQDELNYETGSGDNRAGIDLKLDDDEDEDTVPEDQVIHINEAWLWENTESFEITVTSPQKMKKGSFSKAFIAYEITTIPGPQSVSRRFNQFKWLYKTLCVMYPALVIPILPEKHRSGRFEEEFIEARRWRLEQFVNRLARHPLLRKSEPLKVFLTSNEDKEFEAGKKRVEKECKKFNFLRLIRCDWDIRIADDDSTAHIEAFRKIINHFDQELTALLEALNFTMKQHEINGQSIKGFSAAITVFAGKGEQDHPICWRRSCPCAPLTTAYETLAEKAKKISDEHQRQYHVFEALGNELSEYVGYAQTFIPLLKKRDSVAAVYHSQSSKLVRNPNPTDVDRKRVETLKSRMDKLTYAVLCEQELFHQQRIDDFKKYFDKYVEAQASFHDKLAALWREALPSINAVQPCTGDSSLG